MIYKLLDNAHVKELLDTRRRLENDLEAKKQEMQAAPAASP
jgi:hypothetical protein